MIVSSQAGFDLTLFVDELAGGGLSHVRCRLGDVCRKVETVRHGMTPREDEDLRAKILLSNLIRELYNALVVKLFWCALSARSQRGITY